MRAVGVDFGTTNSALAVCDGPGRAPELALFLHPGADPEPTFRSLLYFEREEGGPLEIFAGPQATERYVSADARGRLMQSLKSFLAARDFSATRVFGVPYRLEALIGLLLRELREQAERSVGPIEGAVVAGRPVRFVSARGPEDDALALQRLRAAYANAGFGPVTFEYEPVAAAYHYERELDHDELILIADCGGGTSDFCLLHVGPSRRSRSATEALLDTEGIAVAGDSFDGRIVRHAVSPALGYGSSIVSLFGQKLDAPGWLFAQLERWHHVSFLRTPRTLQLLYDLCREAEHPERFRAFRYLVEQNLGFALHRAVEDTKRGLSTARSATLELADGPLALRETVRSADFASWIWDDVSQIAACMDRLLGRHGLREADIDRVFLTGGSTFVRALRELFAERFGRDKLRSGAELTSVASGLALRALERD